MISSRSSHPPATSHRRRHRNSHIAAVLRRQYRILGHCNLPKKNSALAGLSSPVNFRRGFPKKGLSARKLAAGLWKMRFMEFSGDGSFCSSRSELANENVSIMLPTHQKTREKHKKTKDLRWRPLTNLHSRNGIRYELESSMPCLKCCKEDATRWDPALSEASNELTQISSSERYEEKRVIGDSVVSALLAELIQAQKYINKLKAARKSYKKKIQQFVHEFEEEKMLWKHREFQKIQAMFDDIKDKLGRERKSRERIELMNAKLVLELAEANQSAMRFMKNYEEEKRGRELMEQVCNELAKQIGEDKGQLEELERESMRIREEVEEERRMMQIAELWREERVQMKLVDARLALEYKYDQMIQLVSNYLHAFLRSRGAAELDKIQGFLEYPFDFSIGQDEDNEDGFGNRSKLHQSSSFSDNNAGLEVDNVHQEDNIIGSEAEYSENTCLQCPKTQVTKLLSASGREFKRNNSSSSASNGVVSPCESEAMNPHITRGMKGCIEWPRGMPKSNLKVVSLDARVRSQKSQLQHILKPKV